MTRASRHVVAPKERLRIQETALHGSDGTNFANGAHDS